MVITARRITILFLVGLVLLPPVGVWIRGGGKQGCALDGAKIEPLYRVRIVDKKNRSLEFCCIRCAQLWLQRQPDMSQAIFVTDEQSGQEIPAASAHFVRSLVVTMPATGNRIHAFADSQRAEEHARLFRGTVLSAAEGPFVR